MIIFAFAVSRFMSHLQIYDALTIYVRHLILLAFRLIDQYPSFSIMTVYPSTFFLESLFSLSLERPRRITALTRCCLHSIDRYLVLFFRFALSKQPSLQRLIFARSSSPCQPQHQLAALIVAAHSYQARFFSEPARRLIYYSICSYSEPARRLMPSNARPKQAEIY